MKPKAFKAWCVYGPDGSQQSNVTPTRTEAIDDAVCQCDKRYRASGDQWIPMRRDGYRCLRVTVTPDKEGR